MRKICALLPLCWFSAGLYAEGGRVEVGASLLRYNYSSMTNNWDDSTLYSGGRKSLAETQSFATMDQDLSIRYMDDKWGFEFLDSTTSNRLLGFYSMMPNVYGQVALTYAQDRTRDKQDDTVITDQKDYMWGLGLGARYYHHHDTCIMDMGGSLEYTRAYEATFDLGGPKDVSTDTRNLNLLLHANYYRAVAEHLYVGGGLTLTAIVTGKSTAISTDEIQTTSGTSKNKGWSLGIELAGVRFSF